MFNLDDILPLETVSSIRKATNGNYALGDSRCQQGIEQALARRARASCAGQARIRLANLPEK